MAAKVKIEGKDVISLGDLAKRFAKAKGMDAVGYNWMREAPGRKGGDDEPTGNSLAMLRAIRGFNATNKNPIGVYKAKGYDGTNKRMLVIPKSEVIRLKGYILRGSAQRPGRKPTPTAFQILGQVEV